MVQVSREDGASDWLSAGTSTRLQPTGQTTRDGGASTAEPATLQTSVILSFQLHQPTSVSALTSLRIRIINVYQLHAATNIILVTYN